MDRPNAPTDWADIRTRWPDHARRVQEQWPEIELGTILATLGDRDRLVTAVAATYGLDPVEADRAVTIWHATRFAHADDVDRSGPSAAPTVA